jgi:hypothetical protein
MLPMRFGRAALEVREIPVYLTDSVLLPGQVDAQRDMFAQDTVSFPMTVGTFEMPREVMDRKPVPELMNMLQEAVVERHAAEAFLRRAVKTSVSALTMTQPPH